MNHDGVEILTGACVEPRAIGDDLVPMAPHL